MSSHMPGSLVSDGTFPTGDQRRMELQKLTVENMGSILHLRGANGNLASFTEKPCFQYSGELASVFCQYRLITDEVCVGSGSEVRSSSQLETRETHRREYTWAMGKVIHEKTLVKMVSVEIGAMCRDSVNILNCKSLRTEATSHTHRKRNAIGRFEGQF